MLRTHNTKRKIGKVWSVYQEEFMYALKPNGFWYGIDGGWGEWCRENMPEWIYGYNYRVELDENRILSLDGISDGVMFDREYGRVIPGCSVLRYIDWRKVAGRYGGIEVMNYGRFYGDLNSSWWRAWDCDSGCVWDSDCVKGIIEIKGVRDEGIHKRDIRCRGAVQT